MFIARATIPDQAIVVFDQENQPLLMIELTSNPEYGEEHKLHFGRWQIEKALHFPVDDIPHMNLQNEKNDQGYTLYILEY